MKDNKQNLTAALWKKALGYRADETVEESGIENGQCVPIKQKVTSKDVPPDLSAIKLLMEEFAADEFATMTEAELEKEKQRLIKELKK